MAQQNLSATTLVIFGITGDLAHRKLLPALYHLLQLNELPAEFALVGVFRKPPNIEELFLKTELTLLKQYGACDPVVLSRLKALLYAVHMDPEQSDHYSQLKSTLTKLDNASGVKHNLLFYLAIPPSAFTTVTSNLAANELCGKHCAVTARILVEKPFGHDLASAKKLIEHLQPLFNEDQVFRIDHYLAKETAQNILTFRFANPLFSHAWHAGGIEKIEIEAYETLGIEGRANFYENLGAIRDLIQSHLLQLMALVLMEQPAEFTSQSIHTAKLNLLHAVEQVELVHKEQYPGYRDEVGNLNSQTETYAKIKVHVANERWRGVPIFISTGKKQTKKVTQINIHFKDAEPHKSLNELSIRLQPEEGVYLKLQAKKPGFVHATEDVVMHFTYEEAFQGTHQPEAYQRVLLDAMKGDQTLFASSDEVIESWRIIEPIL